MSVFTAIPRSFFDPSFYREVHGRPEGLGLMYLFKLALLLVTLITAYVLYMIYGGLTATQELSNSKAETVLYEIAAQIPPLVIQDGALQTQVEMPYAINLSADENEEKYTLAVIDTTGQITSMQDTNAFLLFTEREILMRKSNGAQVFYYQDINDSDPALNSIYFDNNLAKQVISVTLSWLNENIVLLLATIGATIWVVCLALFFVIWIIQALLLGLFGKLIALILSTPLLYHHSVRLAAYALTPPIVINIGKTAAIGEGTEVSVYIVLAVVFMFFAVWSVKQKFVD
ncbi:MAG: hypothetical protein CMM94_02925 [Rickettsiales bacterium]|nr:hypothetical protein [Rickettsiales bacterium]